MAITPFRRVRCDDKNLTDVQNAVGFVFQDIVSRRVLDGQIIKDVEINGSLSVDHKLGRVPNGYIVIFKDANVDIWDAQDSNIIPASTLDLVSSGPATISLWVF